ncbi:hypothetical protein Hanom_Chr11g01052231 [Helianthus anomalus]
MTAATIDPFLFTTTRFRKIITRSQSFLFSSCFPFMWARFHNPRDPKPTINTDTLFHCSHTTPTRNHHHLVTYTRSDTTQPSFRTSLHSPETCTLAGARRRRREFRVILLCNNTWSNPHILFPRNTQRTPR